jgi:hypothetical protein
MSDGSIRINGNTDPALANAEAVDPARRQPPDAAAADRTIAPQLPPEHRDRRRGTEAERAVTYLTSQIIGPNGTCFMQTAPDAPRFLGDRYQMLASQVAARGKDGAPGRIDPATVPAGELGDEEYRVLTERARYLNGLYDRMHPYRLASSWVMPWRLASAETGLLTEDELKERDALNAAIWATVFPEPTPAEARLDAMRANPIGTAYLVASGYDGGDPTFAQSVVFGLGSVVDQAGVGQQINHGPLSRPGPYRLPMTRPPRRPSGDRRAGRPPAREPRGTGDAASLPASVRDERRAALQTLGFSEQWINVHPEALAYDTGSITKWINSLRALRFADPDKLAASARSTVNLGQDTLPGKLDDLRKRGFKFPEAMMNRVAQIAQMDVETIGDKIRILQEAGFSNAAEIFEASPWMLTHDPARLRQVAGIVAKLEDKQSIYIARLISKHQDVINAVEKAAPKTWREAKDEIARAQAARPEAPASAARDELNDGLTDAERFVAGLATLGFTDPLKFVISYPGVMDLPISTIAAKLDDFRAFGFRDPVKLVETAPTALNLAHDTIKEKLDSIRNFGFSDPVDLVTRDPRILISATSTLGDRLNGLRRFGFRDPVMMIEATPNIWAYATESFGKKLDAIRKQGFDPLRIVEAEPWLLTYAPERLGKTAGIVAKLEDKDPIQITYLVRHKIEVIDAVEKAAPKTWKEVGTAVRRAEAEIRLAREAAKRVQGASGR